MFEWGWVVEPDPNYQLSTFTCANRSYKDGGHGLRRTCRTPSTATRRTTRCTPEAGRADRPDRARRHRQADAEDALRRRALRRHDLLRQPRGVPLGPVHRLPAAARARAASLLFQYGTYSYQSTRVRSLAATKAKAAAARSRSRAANSGSLGGWIVGVVIALIVAPCVVFVGDAPARRTASPRSSRVTIAADPTPRPRPRPERERGGTPRPRRAGRYAVRRTAHRPRHDGLRPGVQLLPVPAAAR